MTELADGDHSVRVRAVSSVAPIGVKDPTPPQRNWTVDTVAPDVAIDSAPSGAVVSSNATVTFSSGAAKAVATLEFQPSTSLLNDPQAALLGASLMAGSYAESITGLHRQTLTVSGTFELRRLNEIGELVIN